ncbi:MAG TPA: hypothetical protein VLT86_19590 [Vicinamibacterales bacterium]|nr:hypothetical protein [Vicinamibacterales bacterium]
MDDRSGLEGAHLTRLIGAGDGEPIDGGGVDLIEGDVSRAAVVVRVVQPVVCRVRGVVEFFLRGTAVGRCRAGRANDVVGGSGNDQRGGRPLIEVERHRFEACVAERKRGAARWIAVRLEDEGDNRRVIFRRDRRRTSRRHRGRDEIGEIVDGKGAPERFRRETLRTPTVGEFRPFQVRGDATDQVGTVTARALLRVDRLPVLCLGDREERRIVPSRAACDESDDADERQ